MFQTHPKRDYRLLLVDDDPALLDALSSTLHFRMSHLALETCMDTSDALRRLQRTPFDTLLTDIVMPHMDGMELLRKAKHVRPKMPIVVFSGSVQQGLVTDALALGAAEVCLRRRSTVRHFCERSVGPCTLDGSTRPLTVRSASSVAVLTITDGSLNSSSPNLTSIGLSGRPTRTRTTLSGLPVRMLCNVNASRNGA